MGDPTAFDGDDTPRKTALKPAWAPGQSGNPAGRPKGARSKLGEEFLKHLLEDFTTHGKAAIQKVREEKPDQYIRTIASILPKEIEPSEETLNILSELLARVDGRTRTIAEPVALPETLQ